MVKTTAPLSGRRRRVCRSTRSHSFSPAFSAVRSARRSRGCGWNRVGVLDHRPVRPPDRPLHRQVREEPVGRPAQPGVEAGHRPVDLAQRPAQLLGQPPMRRVAEQGRGQRVGAVLARLHHAEILLRQRGQVGQGGVGGRRQARDAPAPSPRVRARPAGLGQHGQHLGRPLGQERQALGGLVGEVLVAPQPVGRVERVQAHGELPGAVEEDERQLHGRRSRRARICSSRAAGCTRAALGRRSGGDLGVGSLGPKRAAAEMRRARIASHRPVPLFNSRLSAGWHGLSSRTESVRVAGGRDARTIRQAEAKRRQPSLMSADAGEGRARWRRGRNRSAAGHSALAPRLAALSRRSCCRSRQASRRPHCPNRHPRTALSADGEIGSKVRCAEELDPAGGTTAPPEPHKFVLPLPPMPPSTLSGPSRNKLPLSRIPPPAPPPPAEVPNPGEKGTPAVPGAPFANNEPVRKILPPTSEIDPPPAPPAPLDPRESLWRDPPPPPDPILMIISIALP